MDDKNEVECRCTYKCQHFPAGYCKVGRASYYRHEKLSLQGKFHYSVRRSSRLENHRDEAMPDVPTNVMPRHCFCFSCKGELLWSEETVRKHLADDEERLRCETSASGCHNAFEDCDEDNMMDVESSEHSNGLQEANIQNMGSAEAFMTYIVELQALLDKCKVSQDCQGEIMKRLFDDNGVSLRRLLALHAADGAGMKIPTSWKQLINIYKDLGMIETQKWGICMGDTDQSHAPVLLKPGGVQSCTKCRKHKKDCLKFEYLAIKEILARMCMSPSLCHEFLCMWRDRFTWMGSSLDATPMVIKEVWHGTKVHEYQAFWDPESYWEVPVLGPSVNCKRSFRAFPEPLRCEELQKNWDEELGMYSFPCSECGTFIEARRQVIQGDPRNFALLGHWDGFQSARTRSRDCWTLEVAVLNGGKVSSFGPMPIIFITASSEKIIKEAGPNVLSAFLEPFVSELEEMFVHGFPVQYAYPAQLIHKNLVNNNSSNQVNLRAILMMFSGDYPALCKAGGLKDGGYSGCRRHVMQLELHRRGPSSKTTLQYTKTRLYARHPPPRRTCENLLSTVTEWRQMPDNTERSDIGRKGGISGHSILWRLYHLYAFDLSLDLVNDVMHIIALSVFKKYIQLLVKIAMQLGLMKDLEVALAIATKQRPPGLGGRWPKWPRRVKSLKFYKAEECQLFIMWCLPYVLEHLNISKYTVLGGVGAILIDIGRLFYSHSRRYGWTIETIQIARKLLAAWRVRMEESVGPTSSPLEHIAGSGELLDDVLRHGCHDIFWCYAFEREVSTYMEIPTNMKLNESTYIKYFERTLFTSSFLNVRMDRDGLLPQKRALQDLHKHMAKPRYIYAPQIENFFECEDWHSNRVLITHSQDSARDLARLLPLVGRCTCQSMIAQKGILVGPEAPVIHCLDQPTICYLKRFWRDLGVLTDDNLGRFKEEVITMKFLLLCGREYRINSNVLVRPDVPNSSHAWSWKAKISGFFIHEFAGNMQVFFKASYYEQRLAEAGSVMPLVHKNTGMQILDFHPSQFSIMPVSHLMYEFMPLPMPHRRFVTTLQTRPLFVIAFEFEDVTPRTHLLHAGEPGCCPPFPECADVMLVKGKRWESVEDVYEYAVVRDVHQRGPLPMDMSAMDSGDLVEQDALVGTVELSYLHRMGPRSHRYFAAVEADVSCSWHRLVAIVSNAKVVRYEFQYPVEWMID